LQLGFGGEKFQYAKRSAGVNASERALALVLILKMAQNDIEKGQFSDVGEA
jgi:hypothetical protein